MNELVPENNWWKRNWKWFTPTMALISIIVILFFTSNNPVLNIAKAYVDASICDKALEKAKENNEVIGLLGTLDPIDKMALLEGSVLYSNHNDSVAITIRVNGSKNKGKMDISAVRVNEEWEYQKISIRIKDPIKTIQIIQ